MATNSGLTSVNCDTLAVDYTITLQDSNGTAGEVLTSNGDDGSVYWGTNAASTTHPLTAGANVSYGSGAATWNGSIADTIIATDTTYQGGSNISIDTTTNPDTINLDSAPTNLDLTSATNIIHPPNVFDYAGDLRMSIEMGNFYPNDDSSYYNIGVEDDFSAKIHGTLRPLTSTLEVCGYFIIPNNYTATAVRIDCHNSSGVAVSRTIMCASVITYGGTGFTSLNFSGNTNAEFSLSPTMAGASDRIMLITIFTTSTSDHIRGGYIKLTR